MWPVRRVHATQPFPVAPKGLAPQGAGVPWGATEADRAFCAAEMGKLRNEGVFTPPAIGGSYFMPGNVGGMAWGGAAFDPSHRILLIPTNNIGAEVRLIPRAEFVAQRETESRNIAGDWEFAEQRGTPLWDGAPSVACAERTALYRAALGVLNGVDADTGEVKWTTPTGSLKYGVAPAGSISLGGPIATAGGLVFMAGTLDAAIYAFDVETGKQLWRGELPASARATPMTYRGPDGRQYLVIAAGGHGISEFGPVGDSLVAFTLK